MKNFYKSNTFLAIVSFVIAVFLWIYVVYEVNPMYETWISDIPVKCTNVSSLFEDGSLVITGANEKLIKGGATMNVRIKGKRSVISSIDPKNFSCSIDMMTVTKAGEYNLKPTIESDISGLEIVKAEPYKFRFNVENIEQRDIKIDVNVRGELPQGYTIDDVVNHNETVKVTGSTSVIDKIDRAEIVFDYSELEVTDNEKTYKIVYYDNDGNLLSSDNFKKTIEYAKITFNLYTTKEVSVIIMPKYADEITENSQGKSVVLSLSGNGTPTRDGGLEMNVRLKGTSTALEKYADSKRTVYTEDIDVQSIETDQVFEGIKAAELSNNIWYVDVPEVTVKAAVKEKEKTN